MNLLQLNIFKSIVSTKSFSKTAEMLHLSQPAVSQHIHSLEQQYGTKLFDRTTKRVILTRAGRVLDWYATEIIRLLEQSHKEINQTIGEIKGTLLVGASLTIGENILPRIIGLFKNDYPEVEIQMEVSNTHNIVHGILDKRLDVGLIEGPEDYEEINVIPFIRDELQLIVPFTHPLAEKKKVTLNDIARLSFVLREKGSGTRKVMEASLLKAGLDPAALNIALELGSTQAVIGAVEAGFGATFLSSWAVKKELLLETVKAVKISGLKIVRDLAVVYHKKKVHTVATDELIKFINSEKVRDTLTD